MQWSLLTFCHRFLVFKYMDKKNKPNYTIIVAVIVAALVIFFAIKYSGGSAVFSGDDGNSNIQENANNVSVVGGKQIVELKAKGGYSPEHSIAKAGVPTVLRITTNGTFDCSSSLRIPSLNIGQNLPMSGSTDIDLGVQKVITIQGTCGMGMYPFDIKFE